MVASSPGIDAGGPDIYDDIIEALRDNGDLTPKQFRRLVLLTLVDLGRGRRDAKLCKESIDRVDKKVEKLEKYTILLIAHNHPKAATTIGAITALFVITVISRLGLWVWIKEVIEGLLEDPLP